jgi:hypothetical protein
MRGRRNLDSGEEAEPDQEIARQRRKRAILNLALALLLAAPLTGAAVVL